MGIVTTLSLIKGGIGLVQGLFGGGARRRAEKDLEKFANSYQVSPGILDYYNKALARYSPNAYTSSFYQNQANKIARNMATGVNAAQDRRSALSVITNLNQQANDASAKAAATAEQMQGQQLAQLGSAASMKNAAEQKKFDMLYNLKAMKAGQSATLQNQGMQNAYSALSDYAKLKYLFPGSTSNDDWANKFMSKNKRTGATLDEGTQFPGE